MSTTSRIHSRADFRDWERRFDAELKKPAAKIAWRTLLENHCDPQALKSALYYAADHLRLAYDAHRGNEFEIAREQTLTQIARLRETMRQLTSTRIQSKAVASHAMFLWGIKKKEIECFQNFPTLLVRFEKILGVLRLPRARRDTLEDWLIASGESLLHVYVKEVTTKTFSEENAVLLEAAAAACGFDHGREYSTEAVGRRWLRFRKRKDSDHKELRSLVHSIKGSRETFLDDFLDVRIVHLYLEWGLQQYVLTGDSRWFLHYVLMYRKQLSDLS